MTFQENGDLFSFELSEDDMEKIDGLDRNYRVVNIKEENGHHPHFPYKTPEDW